MPRYKVVQTSQALGTVEQGTFQWKAWARFIAWATSGKGHNGDFYATTIEEVD